MKKPKTTQPTNKKDKPTRKVVSPWREDYMDLFTFRLTPITDGFIDRFSKELIDWAENDEKAIKISQFFSKKRIPSKTYYEWTNKYEPIRQAHELAKILIGNRREQGALERKYEASIVKQMMPYYDRDWRDIKSWESKLKEDSDINATKIVIMEKFPETDKVPKKKD